jgi:hypothetical protein
VVTAVWVVLLRVLEDVAEVVSGREDVVNVAAVSLMRARDTAGAVVMVVVGSPPSQSKSVRM